MSTSQISASDSPVSPGDSSDILSKGIAARRITIMNSNDSLGGATYEPNSRIFSKQPTETKFSPKNINTKINVNRLQTNTMADKMPGSVKGKMQL